MSPRLRCSATVVSLCLGFALLEHLSYDMVLHPLRDSLQAVAPGGLSTHKAHLLDGINEWRHLRPELGATLGRLTWRTLALAGIFHLVFSALLLVRVQRGAGGWRPHAVRQIAAMLVQSIYFMLPAGLLLLVLLLCVAGLMSTDPWTYPALGGTVVLWGMLKVSRERCWALVGQRSHPLSPGLVVSAVGTWWTDPLKMLSAWLLWLTQQAVAAGPLWQQIHQTPGPTDPRGPLLFLGASYFVYALRQWQLCSRSTGRADEVPTTS